MSFDYDDYRTLQDIKKTCKSNTKQQKELMEICKNNTQLQKDLMEAFNAQTAAIERQNALQEKMLDILGGISKNTAPKVKIVDKPKNKTAL